MRGLLLALLFSAAASCKALAEAAVVLGLMPDGGYIHTYSNDFPTAAAATENAFDNCYKKTPNCSLVWQFKTTCMAMAYADRGTGYFSWGTNEDEARGRALSRCNHTSCRIVRVYCDTVNGDTQLNLTPSVTPAQIEKNYADAQAEIRKRKEMQEAGRLASENWERQQRIEKLKEHLPIFIVTALAVLVLLVLAWNKRENLKLGSFKFSSLKLPIFAIPRFTIPEFADTPYKGAETVVTDPPAEPLIRDTPTAIAAMELANAYLDEIEPNIEQAPKDAEIAKNCLRTLALASKQIEAAEKADPTATIAVTDDNGTADVNLTALKAYALFYEAFCRFDNPRKAIRILEQCVAFEPLAAKAHFWIGLLNTAIYKKQAAINALQTAAAIDPKNIEYRKMLDRARNLSRTEILLDRSIAAGKGAAHRGAVIGLWLFLIGGFAYGIYFQNWAAAGTTLLIFWLIGMTLKGTDKVKAWFGR